MTLVIAKKIDNYLRIESDSKLTSIKQIHSNPYLFGALKTIIVNKNICVSFAGRIEEADGTNYPKISFKEIFNNDIFSLPAVLSTLMKVHKQSNNKIDFIVGYQDDESAELIKIQNSKIHKNCDNFWIGDSKGFAIFQKEFLSKSYNKNLTSEEKASLMIDSFKQVINNDSVKGIDGLMVSVFSRQGYFEYLEGFDLTNQKKITVKPKEMKRIPFGEAVDGSFGVSYLVNDENSPYAIAIYFPQGKMGVLYFPQFSLEKILIKDVTNIDFIENISKDYGIKLHGFIIDLEKGQAKYVGKKTGKFKFSFSGKYKKSPALDNPST